MTWEERREARAGYAEQGRRIRQTLTECCLTQRWLTHELERQGGEHLTESAYTRIFNGERGSERTEQILKKSQYILDRYMELYLNNMPQKVNGGKGETL
ncbi:MAG: hypothetical protein LUI01_00295 [Firmicutes bacterium]|nr:hypothetical protein [Bacillota bacterium]